MSDLVPRLEGRREPWLESLLDEPATLHDLVDEHGSPVHLLSADPFVANHEALVAAAASHGLDALVLYARKANRAGLFVDAAAAAGAGVDTASLAELDDALAAGVPAERLVVTAAVKPPALLSRALETGVTVVVDNDDEVAALRRLDDRLPRDGDRPPPSTALRVSGFPLPAGRGYSRFGVPVSTARDLVASAMGGRLAPSGLHFHLDGYSVAERATALHACLDLAAELTADGVDLRWIDVGGGLRVSYLDDDEQWAAFWVELRAALHGRRSPITFGNDGLGLELVDGEVVGTPAVYPFREDRPGPLFLDDVLRGVDAQGRTAARRLRDAGLSLRLEPGRALLDGCGATVARVVHRKVDARGDLLVGLEMTGSQHGSSSADVLVDPLLVSRDPAPRQADDDGPRSAYLTGATCTEGDLVLRRRVLLPRHPAVGDLVVLVNTAGYFMHFRATDGHGFGPAADVVVEIGRDGRAATTRDRLQRR